MSIFCNHKKRVDNDMPGPAGGQRKRANRKDREELELQRNELAAARRLYELSTRPVSQGNLDDMLAEVLDTAIWLTKADMGNLQLLDERSGLLKIESHRGFGPDFLAFFDSVQPGVGACGSSCGAALARRQRIIVADICQSPIFVGTPSLDIMLSAGVRACQSTPLVSREGRLVGMLSTHFRRTIGGDELNLHLLDLLASQTADMIVQIRVQAALEENRERFRVLVEATAQAVWETDAAGEGFEDSPTWRAYTGQTLAELLGSGWLDAVHPDDRAYAEQQWREAVAAGRNVNAEFRLKSPDGGWRWTNMHAAPLLATDGTIAKWVGMNIDIDNRKRAEAALRESDERYRLVLGAFQAMVYDYDVAGARINAMHGLENLAGYRQQDNTVSPAWWDKRVHPDDRGRYRDTLAQMLAAPHNAVFQYRFRHRDGHYIEFEDFAKPFCDQTGRVTRIIGIAVDISGRKRLEQELRRHRDRLERLVEERTGELRRSERHYRTLIENLPILVSRYDTDLRYLYRSPQFDDRYALPSREFIGKTWREIGIPEDKYLPWRETLIQSLKTGRCHEFESSLPHKGGGTRDYITRVIPEFDSRGDVESLLAVSQDVTERKQMEAELTRLDRLNTVGEMAAAIGHEVRNPLTTVRGYLQMFLRKAESAEYREQFETMIGELDRANEIISGFLSLAKNKVVELKPCNLNTVISALMPLLQAEASRTGHDLKVDMGDVPDIEIDDKEIRQLLLNLARNGLEAMAGGGSLTIRTFVDSGQPVLAVADCGRGIAKDVLDKLGTPFLTTKENGTGLGLPVCYRIAERHGARIEIQTSPCGTTFSVYFPKPPI